MAANLTPQYLQAEEAYRAARTPEERLAALEQMWRELPKHKSSEKLQAELKKKLSAARKELQQETRRSSRKTDPFAIPKSGAGQVVLIGIPHADVVIKEKTWARLMRLEIDVLGSWNSFSAPYPGAEWETTVAKMASGELKWEFMITHEEPVERVPELIGQMARREIVSSKVLFHPNGKS